MSFSCQQCGECCSVMGEIIGIEEQTGSFSFRICFAPTGERREVTIDHEKERLFSSQDIQKIRPRACPFLCESSSGEIICSVHATRPEICRRYACFRILILDHEGRRIGRVADGNRYFISGDPALNDLWRRKIAGSCISDETLWEDHAERIFSEAGYRVIR